MTNNETIYVCVIFLTLFTSYFMFNWVLSLYNRIFTLKKEIQEWEKAYEDKVNELREIILNDK